MYLKELKVGDYVKLKKDSPFYHKEKLAKVLKKDKDLSKIMGDEWYKLKFLNDNFTGFYHITDFIILSGKSNVNCKNIIIK